MVNHSVMLLRMVHDKPFSRALVQGMVHGSHFSCAVISNNAW